MSTANRYTGKRHGGAKIDDPVFTAGEDASDTMTWRRDSLSTLSRKALRTSKFADELPTTKCGALGGGFVAAVRPPWTVPAQTALA